LRVRRRTSEHRQAARVVRRGPVLILHLARARLETVERVLALARAVLTDDVREVRHALLEPREDRLVLRRGEARELREHRHEHLFAELGVELGLVLEDLREELALLERLGVT